MKLSKYWQEGKYSYSYLQLSSEVKASVGYEKGQWVGKVLGQTVEGNELASVKAAVEEKALERLKLMHARLMAKVETE